MSDVVTAFLFFGYSHLHMSPLRLVLSTYNYEVKRGNRLADDCLCCRVDSESGSGGITLVSPACRLYLSHYPQLLLDSMSIGSNFMASCSLLTF